MLVPPFYRPDDDSWALSLMADHPLAVLVTAHDEQPFATHVPVLIDDPHAAEQTGAVNLVGHMNRRNPHWERLRGGAVAKVLFAGPHGYVSPALYQVSPAAPTWDFTAVHASGMLERIDAPEETRRIVRMTAARLEARFGLGWDMTSSLAYFEQILPGVGAFRVAVTSISSMFKLSQEQPEPVRRRLIKAFRDSDSEAYREIAALMCKWPVGSAVGG